MYDYLYTMLNRYYPERETTVTTTDPYFVAPVVKAMLRRKNRLMQAGRVEEAAAIAKTVWSIIHQRNSVHLRKYGTRQNVCETWSKVWEVTQGRSNYRDIAPESTLTTDALNRYYEDISTDQAYISAKQKLTAVGADDYFTEHDVFHMVDCQKPTATGIDGLPVWFLRISAPIITAPLAAVFNHSISAGVVLREGKNAIITPVPEISVPIVASDYRPISVI